VKYLQGGYGRAFRRPVRLSPVQGRAALLATKTGTILLFPKEFDLIRRPFWVWNRILEGKLSRG
jgi:hypothetical protein